MPLFKLGKPTFFDLNLIQYIILKYTPLPISVSVFELDDTLDIIP